MAIKKVDKHVIGAGETVELSLTSTSASTSGLTVYAYARDEAGTDTVLDSTAGATAGTEISLLCNFSSLTSGKKYEVFVVADPDGTPIRMLPNNDTADKILVYIDPIPSSTS
jgi:hypothetical protein